MRRVVRALLCVVVAVGLHPALAQDAGTFDPLVIDELSIAGTVRTIDDPTGVAPTAKVYSFTIPAGSCNPTPYEAGTDDSDCKFNSSRSQIRENVFATRTNGNGQPAEAWYTFAIYLPEDFPYGDKQISGGLEFAYWHNKQCPHLTFTSHAGSETALFLGTNRALGDYDCMPGPRVKVAEFSELVGKWTRFEVFVKWANDDSGRALVYLNGRLASEYSGPTLTAGFEKTNYFKFGLYLCCTPDHAGIKQASLLYSSVKRAAKREGLFTPEDQSALRELQNVLNVLGCDVGAADGVIGRRTREQAMNCRAFPDGSLPPTLSAGSVRTFLAFYTGAGVADLPLGKPGEPVEEVALATNIGARVEVPTGRIAPDFVVQTSEVMVHKAGKDTEANSAFSSRVKGADVKTLDFSVMGRFDYAVENFLELEMFLNDAVTVNTAIAACGPDAIVTFPDGSDHALLQFTPTVTGFRSVNAACLVDALPAKQAKQVAFLTEHFADVAIGMLTDGSIESLQHEGLKIFFTRVAKGEVTVDRQ